MLRRFLGLVTVISFLFSCVQFDKAKLDNRSGEVRVIGHAGSGFAAWWPFNSLPANSMASIQKAMNEGAEGVEVDVHMTADKKFILYHDNKLDSKTDLKGCPSDYPLESLKGIPYKVDLPFSLFGRHELISLDDLIEYFKQLNEFPELHLDLRNHSACEDEAWDFQWEVEMIQALGQSIKQWDLPKDKLLLISYSRAMLEEALRLGIDTKISFEIVGELDNGVQWAKSQGIKILTIKPKLIDPGTVKQLHDQGFEIITFGAKSRSGNKKMLELNPDAIQTNNVKALNSLLNKN